MEIDALAWSQLAAAIVVAAMAFAGLMFVAVSINLEPIITLAGVADFALAGLIVLTGIAISGIFLLVPGQPVAVLGAELVILGGVLSVASFRLLSHSYRATDQQYRRNRIYSGALNGAPGILFVVAGVSTVGSFGGGLYWLVPGWVVGLVAGILNAWVLLVEVKR